MISAVPPEHLVDDRRARRNVAVLVFANAVLGSQLAINIIVAGLAGALLAENEALATLPLSVVVLSSMFTAPVASMLMGRFGRRAGFLLGALAGGIGSALSARALFVGSFGRGRQQRDAGRREIRDDPLGLAAKWSGPARRGRPGGELAPRLRPSLSPLARRRTDCSRCLR